MAEAEKKDIAQLDFNIQQAINSLDKIDQKLKTISESSEAYAKKIGQNIGVALNNNVTIDTQKIQKNRNKILQNDKIFIRNSELENQRHNNKIQEQNHKSMLKQEEYNNRMLKSTKTMYDKIGEYAKTYVIYQGFNQLKQGITATIEEMVEVEYQMVQIDRVLNDSSLNIDLYRDKLIQLAYDYGNSFKNVADITLRLAQAGYDAEESLALTEKTLLALNTAELNATQATEDMVAVMAQWGLMTGTANEQAETYGNIIDKINKVADNFPTTSEDILEALKKTSSAFNIAGASIDETIAMIVAAETASQRGGKTIGTALSNIIQQLRTEGRLSLAEEMGLDFFTDTDKTEFRPIMEIFADMSQMMQNLKDEGKENSVEMQNLLEMFTVFRRNIGSSLLGEMAGEDSTYAKVLETSYSAVGYSLQENEKHMKTAKAAQEQFNATLLKLKTEVWEGGLEDVFRSMLALGTNLVEGITAITETFGVIPTGIGLVVAAFTLLNKQMRIYNKVQKEAKDGTIITVKEMNNWASKIKELITQIKLQNTYVELQADGTQKMSFNMKGAIKTLFNLKSAQNSAAVSTAWLEVKTIALQAAYSVGLSLAITAVIKVLDNLVHAEERAAEAAQQELDSINQQISEYENEIEAIEKLTTEYDSLKKAYDEINNIQENERTTEEQEKLLDLTKDMKNKQTEITAFLKEQRQYTQDLVGNYDAQYEKAKEILKTNKEDLIITQKKALILAQEAFKPEEFATLGEQFSGKISPSDFDYRMREMGFDTEYFSKYGKGTTAAATMGILNALNTLEAGDQLEVLTEMSEKLVQADEAGEDVGKTLTYINDKLEILQERQNAVTDSQNNLNDSLISMKLDEYIINDVEDYKKVLEEISNSEAMIVPQGYTGSLKELKEELIILIEEKFPEYAQKAKEMEDTNLYGIDILRNLTSETSKLQEQYTILTTAENELNESGQITAATMQSILDKNLLSYLTVVNGQVKINTQSMKELAEENRINAIETLKNQAVQDLENLTLGETENLSNLAKNALAKLTENEQKLSTQTKNTTTDLLGMVGALNELAEANARAVGEDPTTGISAEDYKKKATAIINSYKSIAASIGSLGITAATRKSSGSSSAAKRDAEREAQEAKKAAEEAYKARLEAFEDYIDETERLEKRWVDKQKDLGQLTNKDYMYIMQQRIERYKKYIEEVKKATWMAEEDRLKLIKEYSEKIEDYQVDYLGYLEDQLDDEIKALEDATDEKIKLIEKEADARIEALDRVTEATDRAREKENYENERQSILEEISYWEQRTGREAQEALKEAKEKLAELDAEWEDTQEDWSIEDQIKKIEEERDAEIKALEEQRDAEIKAMQDVYDAKVKLFAETGQIIYEGSVIQSQNLYNAYKENFIDPISSELEKLKNTSSATATQSQEQQYETYTIKAGDTMSKIANRYGTTVEKIMAANPYVTNANRIFAGKTLQIPKFHEGGIVGGNQEAFALLKPHEVILKPEWADGINKLAQMARNEQNPITNNSTVIEVKGDLVRIDANIKDKTDAEYLTRRIEKTLKEKFNIKK